MKKIMLFAFVMLIAASCSSIRVSSDFDKEAKFSSYKTYKFTDEAMNLPVDDINKQRILKAIEEQLASKGFTKAENPDVLIDVKIKAKAVQTATEYTNYYGSGYRYRWGGGFSSSQIDVEEYIEGTMFVDMIDAAKKQLVWQGRGIGTIDPEASSQKREKNINHAIQQIFLKYPPKL